MTSTVDRSVTDADMRRALAKRLAAWAFLGPYHLPIRRLSPEARRAVDDASDRIASARRTLVAGLWQRAGRWVDQSNYVELVLAADGEGYLMIAPGVVRPGVRLLEAAEQANARRFALQSLAHTDGVARTHEHVN